MSPQAVVRTCCIRSFGHFVSRLQGGVLRFSPAVGIFVSAAPSEQDGLLQQAQAQLRMVSHRDTTAVCTEEPARLGSVMWPGAGGAWEHGSLAAWQPGTGPVSTAGAEGRLSPPGLCTEESPTLLSYVRISFRDCRDD